MVATFVRRHPLRTAVGAFAIVGVALLLVAYVIVPALVRSTLVEELPAAAGPATQTLLEGELVRINAVDYGSGRVRVVKSGDDRFVRFENVDIAGAPDMYVYLSDRRDGQPGAFVDLGKLKATNGSFNYPIPKSVDLATARSVVIWCRQFTVTVTYAVLA
jgi:hypothetical protein